LGPFETSIPFPAIGSKVQMMVGPKPTPNGLCWRLFVRVYVREKAHFFLIILKIFEKNYVKNKKIKMYSYVQRET
jgi:hypothetical protein